MTDENTGTQVLPEIVIDFGQSQRRLRRRRVKPPINLLNDQEMRMKNRAIK